MKRYHNKKIKPHWTKINFLDLTIGYVDLQRLDLPGRFFMMNTPRGATVISNEDFESVWIEDPATATYLMMRYSA